MKIVVVCKTLNHQYAKATSGSGQSPTWWNLPSSNIYCKGMTNGEEITDYLERHGIKVENDKYVFYHATPADTLPVIRSQGLKKGSYLAATKEKAKAMVAQFHKNARGIKVLTVSVYPWQIIPGVHPTLRENLMITV